MKIVVGCLSWVIYSTFSLILLKRKLSRLLGKFFLSNLVFASAGKVMQSVWTHHVIEHCGYVYSACLLLLRVLC
ncbi:hypothetical protein NC652_041794 [Populus alba x Populus x berolinensis]|nr:hypothetical protein NC652_041794 [Populus alba x Populus x berolinensis]